MNDKRLIFGIYAGFFLVLLYFMTAASDAFLGMRFLDVADLRILSILPLKNLSGLILAVAITVFFWKGKKGLFMDELEKAIIELKKVTTPTKDETKVTTISVFVFVGIMIVVFVIFDLIWSNLSYLIY